jgi:hypothetical protein
VALFIGSPARCQNPPEATELVRYIRELHEKPDMRERGRLVFTSPGKAQTVFQISILRKSLPQGVRLLWSVTDPPAARLQILIETQADGERKIWLASGPGGKATLLPEKRWSERVLDSDLAITDLTNDFLAWPSQAVMRTEAFQGRSCYVLRSQSDSRGDGVYASVTAWINREGLLPLRVLKQLKGTAAEKEFLVLGTRKTSGRLEAASVEIRTVGAATTTRLAFTAGSGNAKVKDSEVDPALLFQPAER